jgi:hypothetical protein
VFGCSAQATLVPAVGGTPNTTPVFDTTPRCHHLNDNQTSVALPAHILKISHSHLSFISPPPALLNGFLRVKYVCILGAKPIYSPSKRALNGCRPSPHFRTGFLRGYLRSKQSPIVKYKSLDPVLQDLSPPIPPRRSDYLPKRCPRKVINLDHTHTHTACQCSPFTPPPKDRAVDHPPRPHLPTRVHQHRAFLRNLSPYPLYLLAISPQRLLGSRIPMKRLDACLHPQIQELQPP